MKFLILNLFLLTAQAALLQNDPNFSYEVYFTNPECETYFYEESVVAQNGDKIDSRPDNVYCKKSDFDLNVNRENSPHYQVKALLNKDYDTYFFSYFSFSNTDVFNEMCEQLQSRDISIEFLIDSRSGSKESTKEKLEALSECADKRAGSSFVSYLRGNRGGIGLAHNKLIIASADDKDEVVLVYGSGNMSSGTILHHENWSFVKASKSSFFVQRHFCLKEATAHHSERKRDFVDYMKACTDSIEAEKEEDISFYFVPGEGEMTLDAIYKELDSATAVDMAVHRISHKDLITALTEFAKKGNPSRLIADDDLYWSGVLRRGIGSNSVGEYFQVMKMVRSGFDVHYMETNENHRLLHHNKFIIFHQENGGAVLTGAGNFSHAAFERNFENYYLIKIPSVVAKFKEQYQRMFTELATSVEDLPSEYVHP